MLSFELDGDEALLRHFLSALKFVYIGRIVGWRRKPDIACSNHMTYAGMTVEGISDILLRISVGIKDSESEDLIADLERAFQTAATR